VDFDRLLGLIGLVVGVAPYGALVLRWAAARRPARSFLGLNRTQPVEVIVSTNASKAAGAGEAKTFMTAVGELRAVAVGARTVLPLYKRKKVSVFMSEEYPGRLQADTLILGGPLRNKYAQRLIDYLNRGYPEACLHLDALASEIGIGGKVLRFDQHREGGVPQEDLALLLLARVQGQDGTEQRFVLCAGLSTYGTEGAARFLFQRIMKSTPEAVRLRRLLDGKVAAGIVHVHIQARQVIRTELLEETCWSTDRRANLASGRRPATASNPVDLRHRTHVLPHHD